MSLKKIGGSKVLADTWSGLRDLKKAGHGKRQAQEDDLLTSKRLKHDLETGTGLKTGVVALSSKLSSHIEDKQGVSQQKTMGARKALKAHRKRLIVPAKITGWLTVKAPVGGQAQTPQPCLERDEAVDVPEDPSLKKKNKRKKRQKKHLPAATPDPVPVPSAPQNSPRTPRNAGPPTMDNSAAAAKKRQSSIYWYVSETSPVLRGRASLVDQQVLLANDSEDQRLDGECGVQSRI